MPERPNLGAQSRDHQRAAEMHDAAVHAHTVAAQAHEKEDHLTGHEHSRQALEYSGKAHQQTDQTRRDVANGSDHTSFGHQEIAARALGLWRARGCPEGSPDEDWFHAVKELRAHFRLTAQETKAQKETENV